MNKEKLVTLNNGRKLKFIFPGLGLAQEADIEFSKAYTKALKAGLLPRMAMDKLIVENELWTEEDEKKISESTLNMQDAMLKINGTDVKPEDVVKLREDFKKYQNICIEGNIKKQSLYNNTAEAKGVEAKNIDLFWKCTLNEDGTRVWKSSKDFFNDTDTGWIGEAAQQFIIFINDLEEKINSLDALFKDKDKEVVIKEEIVVEEAKV